MHRHCTQTMTAQRGFTLPELMVTIAVLGILIAIAMPNYQRLVIDQRLGTAAEQLHGALMLARSEAIKRNDTVRLELPDGNDDWQEGWQVVADDEVIIAQDALAAIAIVSTPGNLSTITFNRAGRADTSGEVFSICSNPLNGGTERIIRIDISGMARVERGDTCSE